MEEIKEDEQNGTGNETKPDKKDDQKREIGDISQAELEQFVNAFMERYFDRVNKVVEFNRAFLADNGFSEPDIDFIKLIRFIETAINNLKELEQSFLDGLTGKLYSNVSKLYEYMCDFEKANLVGKIIYTRDFLSTLKPYTELTSEVEKTETLASRYDGVAAHTQAEIDEMGSSKKEEDIKKLKELKRRNVDAIYNSGVQKEKLVVYKRKLLELQELCEAHFFDVFEARKKFYVESLRLIVNTKIYYLNAILWNRAKRSNSIKKFFYEAGIKAEIGLKAYIQYYLKGVDVSKTKNSEWHEYLMDVMQRVD